MECFPVVSLLWSLFPAELIPLPHFFHQSRNRESARPILQGSKTLSGNTRVKKLEIVKKLPDVINKKSIKAAATKKAKEAEAALAAEALDKALDKQLKELETELKQTKAQLKKASAEEKALIKAEKIKDAALKKALHEETAKLKKKKK